MKASVEGREVAARFVQFQSTEVPTSFPTQLLDLHNRLAGTKTRLIQLDNSGKLEVLATQGEAEEGPQTWKDKFKDFGRHVYLHLIVEPTIAGFEVVLGRCPDRVTTLLLGTTSPGKVKSRLWAGAHGLSHILLGVLPSSLRPEAFKRLHRHALRKAHPDQDIEHRMEEVVKYLRESQRSHDTFAAMSDAEIAGILEEKMQPAYPMGSKPWWALAQAISRLRDDSGATKASAPVEGATPLTTQKEPTKTTQEEEEVTYVPTPSQQEFEELMGVPDKPKETDPAPTDK